MKKTVLWLVLITGILISTNPAPAMDRITLLTQIRYAIRDASTDTARNRWSDVIISTRINEIQKNISAITRCMAGRIRITTVADQREYVFPEIVGEITRVSYAISADSTTYKRLPRVSFYFLDKDNAEWDNETSGNPDCYYIRRNRVGLSPPPSSSYVGTNFLQIDFAYVPNDLTDNDDVPFGDLKSLYPYHQLIIWGVAALCKFDEGDFAGGKNFYDLYIAGVALMQKQILERGDTYEFGPIRGKIK